MFKGPVPPVVSFSMGSLGFMTPFRILFYKTSFLVLSLIAVRLFCATVFFLADAMRSTVKFSAAKSVLRISIFNFPP